MTESAALLDFPQGTTLVRDEDAPMPFAVWLDDDILGAGDTSEEAIADARATVSAWDRNEWAR